MASEFTDQKPIIDPTESVSALGVKLDRWTRRGTPCRVYASDDTTITVDDWDLVSGTPSDTALAEVVVALDGVSTIALPELASNVGRLIRIKNAGLSSVSLDPDGSEEIDGGSSLSVSAGDGVTIVAAKTGTSSYEWFTV